MSLAYTDIILNFIGGLSFFLYGLMALSESLQNVAGKRMRYFLEATTKTPLRSVFTGTLFTALIQSSSGTTVIVVGLLNAGLITLAQGAGIIIGANIGTTVTAFIIGIKLSNYSFIFVGLGIVLRMAGKNKKIKDYGRALFGFGILFFGMDLMGSSMEPIKKSDLFLQLLGYLETNSIIGIFMGAFLTALIQSSSAMIGILQELFNQNAITLDQLIPVMMGTNIGTTITAFLASIGGTVSAKRAALFHTIFNAIGTLIFIPLFYSGFYVSSVIAFNNYIFGSENSWDRVSSKIKIAELNAFYNIGNALIFIPIIGFLVWLTIKIIKDTGDREKFYRINLDTKLMKTKEVAMKNAYNELVHMANVAKASLENLMEIFNSKEGIPQEKLNEAERLEDLLDLMEEKLGDYILMISSSESNDKLSQEGVFIFETMKSLERIGDHVQNILEVILYQRRNSVKLPISFEYKINNLAKLSLSFLEDLIKGIEKRDDSFMQKIIENENKVYNIEQEYKREQSSGKGYSKEDGRANYIFFNINSNFARIAVHIEDTARNFKEIFVNGR